MSRTIRSTLVIALVPVLLAIAAPVADADMSGVYLIRANNTVLTSEFAISSFAFSPAVQSGAHGYGSRTSKYLVASSATLTKQSGKDSPELLTAIAKGTHFNELRFQFNKGSTPYLRYCFQDVLLTSQHTGGDPPSESIGFNYSKMSSLNNPATDDLADGCSGGSKSPQPPGVDAWVVNLKGSKAKATLGVACLSKTCSSTIKMLPRGGACPAAKGCKPLGQAKFKLTGGAAKTLGMKLTKSGAAKLKHKPGLAVSLFGGLKGHKQRLIRRNVLEVPAVQKNAPISLSCPSGATIGAALAFTGGVKRSGTTGTGVPVQITLSGPGGRSVSVSAISDGQGNYAGEFTPDVPGDWSASASWPGSAKEKPSQSPHCATGVSRTPASLTLSCPAGPIIVDFPTNFTGTLAPPQGGQTVQIAYTNLTTSAVVTHLATLDAAGNYSDPLTPGLPLGASWTAVAHYLGDASVAPADSASCSFLTG